MQYFATTGSISILNELGLKVFCSTEMTPASSKAFIDNGSAAGGGATGGAATGGAATGGVVTSGDAFPSCG